MEILDVLRKPISTWLLDFESSKSWSVSIVFVISWFILTGVVSLGTLGLILITSSWLHLQFEVQLPTKLLGSAVEFVGSVTPVVLAAFLAKKKWHPANRLLILFLLIATGLPNLVRWLPLVGLAHLRVRSR